MDWAHIVLVLLIALGLNMPLGAWRSHTRKFSLQWFLAVHLSVPFIVLLRLYWEVPVITVPLVIACAVLGQYLGSNRVLGWGAKR